MTATAVTRICCSDARPGWPASWPFVAGLVVVTGAVLGIGTQVLQGALPGGWGVLANSGVMWAFGAFARPAGAATSKAGQVQVLFPE